MGRFTLRRLVSVIVVLWGVSTLVFLLLRLIPGDPVAIMLGDSAAKADIAAMRKDLGLDQSMIGQYGLYLKHFLDGTWGESFSHRMPVRLLVQERFPATLLLAGTSLLIALAGALPLGIWAARRSGSWIDSLVTATSLLGASLPIFVTAPIAVLLFAIWKPWFPVSGSGTVAHLVLPSLCLGLVLAGVLARMVRGAVLECLDEDFVRTARAKGLPETTVILRHVLRNASVPLLTVLVNMFGSLLAGAVLTETLFDWPGLGRLFFAAFQARDYPLVQGVVLWTASVYVLLQFALDLFYPWVDPRIAFEDESA